MNVLNDMEEFQLVVFSVGGNDFGIHISVVREIIAPSKFVSLPNMPPSMVGIINVRGTVLPIVDLKNRFGMGSYLSVDSTNQRILLVEMEGSMVGFLVDTVSEVLRVSRNSLEQVERIQGMNLNLVDYICNLGERLIPVVDVTKLMTNQEIQQLEVATKEGTVCSEI
ncbi:MAG: chemotaxis protein CheW [Firmicutes bacterium]|nr:chemotaxis protein CheW [Bacillota bacterium]